jgi:hypothetical protein
LDGYGPTILSVLEYFSRMYGVYAQNDTIHFNGLPSEHRYSYTQKLNENQFKLVHKNKQITGYLNDREIFRATAGIKVMTDLKGNLLGLAGIDTLVRNVKFETNGKSLRGIIEPNGAYRLKNEKIQQVKKVPFDYPSK